MPCIDGLCFLLGVYAGTACNGGQQARPPPAPHLNPTILTPTCRMDPPAMPPLMSSTSLPGRLTSNERMTIICVVPEPSRAGQSEPGSPPFMQPRAAGASSSGCWRANTCGARLPAAAR